MRPLPDITPTDEQLTVIDDATTGFWLIRGAAGSGKTTTAIKRMQFLIGYHRELRETAGITEPVRALLLTFNRTLCGYVTELARHNIIERDSHVLEIDTFGGWSQKRLIAEIMTPQATDRLILEHKGTFDLDDRLLLDEVRYVGGLYLPRDRARYLTNERTGRGRLPPRITDVRQKVLDLMARYDETKRQRNLADWNDAAATLAEQQVFAPYDIVVVDEAQDFSANQVRAIVRHLAEGHTTTFVRDNVQRIYPHYFTWRNVGVTIPPPSNRRLEVNHRNTAEIARFARPLVADLPIDARDGGDGNGELPDFKHCVDNGDRPRVLRGSYPNQVEWVIERILAGEFGEIDTIGFLHPKGWFRDLMWPLKRVGLPFADITRVKTWPPGDERIALTTMHSAKGLEFDHVVILGYDGVTLDVGSDDEDDRLQQHRRMLAMSAGRARKTLTVGFAATDEPPLLRFLDPDTYDPEDV